MSHSSSAAWQDQWDSVAGNVDAITERCHLAFPTKAAPMMRRCGPFGFGGMMEPWKYHFS